MRAGYSTITTPSALSGFLVGKSRQCSQRQISSRRNVCFPSSGTRKACCTTRVNATTYFNQLASLALVLREKRPRLSAVHLLHDNARPHVAKATQAKLQELSWDTVSHPPYSPDIAPSDYHLFRPLKLFLKEKRFAKYEDLKMAVFDFFDTQSERWLVGLFQ
uniref:Histone-lysine N-methyltransferase SETMAR n=1 Tax=Caenorhabditis japonica TaxID=281687 RepID=A0A8R1I3E8_CAEJA